MINNGGTGAVLLAPIAGFSIAPAVTSLSIVPALVLGLVIAGPVLVATLVFAWHSLRGTKPGAGGELLLRVVELVLPNRSRSEKKGAASRE